MKLHYIITGAIDGYPCISFFKSAEECTKVLEKLERKGKANDVMSEGDVIDTDKIVFETVESYFGEPE